MRVKEPNIETDQIYLRFLVEFLILKIKMESGEINKITHGKSDTGGGGDHSSIWKSVGNNDKEFYLKKFRS